MDFILNEDFVQVVEEVKDWETSIRQASEPLLAHGYIDDSYIEDMIKTAIDLNFYIVIMPEVAMPHARNNDNVYKNGFSVMTLRKSTNFSVEYKSSEDDVKIIIPLACVDNESHMNMLMNIAGILGDEEKLEKLKQALTKEEILEVFK